MLTSKRGPILVPVTIIVGAKLLPYDQNQKPNPRPKIRRTGLVWKLLPLAVVLSMTAACESANTGKASPTPDVAAVPSKTSQAIHDQALAYFKYSTPDEWSKSWLTDARVSDSGALIIQASNGWLALPKYERRQLAEQLEKRWGIALEIGGNSNPNPFITIKDVSGHTVGGSRLTGIWVEE